VDSLAQFVEDLIKGHHFVQIVCFMHNFSTAFLASLVRCCSAAIDAPADGSGPRTNSIVLRASSLYLSYLSMLFSTLFCITGVSLRRSQACSTTSRTQPRAISAGTVKLCLIGVPSPDLSTRVALGLGLFCASRTCLIMFSMSVAVKGSTLRKTRIPERMDRCVSAMVIYIIIRSLNM
jgi:hypothetical protein